MFFSKYPHPANFRFVEDFDPDSGSAKVGQRNPRVHLESFEGGIFRVVVRDERIWKPDPSLVKLEIPGAPRTNHVCVESAFDLTFLDDSGSPALATTPGQGFGLCGNAHLFQFQVPFEAQFFGLGGKWLNRLEMSGVRTKFWNTDVWSDFHWAQWGSHEIDPPYFSTPYVAMKTPKHWIGLLLDNPATTFIQTPGRDDTRVFVEWQRTLPRLVLGSEDGEPRLVVMVADSLAELTEKLQTIVGKTPRPPIWSIGFHQSRWGYGGHKDLVDLDRRFEKYDIPCSGLWLDLDYMDGFRIFQTSKQQFPKGPGETAAALAKNDRRIVPIIDPGVKQEAGYRVFDDGMKNGVFCRNVEGQPYVGLVWPGETVFPDFTQPKVRDWWAGYAKEFRESGFGAAWLDMNDPSTGPVDPTGMLFNDGQEAHALHRNQYALGMQMATRKGFLLAYPEERPFLLSRSGFTGTSRFSAIWTGDNVSNEFYLRHAITTSLGMAISGLPFNGPDVGGFGGDADDELMVRWVQACFLFPFFRNHSTLGSRNEEPWAYRAKTRSVIGHFIQLRYRLLPYLYQLFLRQEARGEALLRPLFHDFDQAGLETVLDEFLVGPDILQAPVVAMGEYRREVLLPGDQPWFDAQTGRWKKPGKSSVSALLPASPLYLRSGAVIPIQRRQPTDNHVDLARPALLCALPADWKGHTVLEYEFDDGLSYGYEKGERTRVRIEVDGRKDTVEVRTVALEEGFGALEPEFWFVENDRHVKVDGEAKSLKETSLALTGRKLTVYAAQ
ncbi:MAG: hypothetical protein KIT11_09580 [Fimbriimonadaceae bacterium]|nr:hypothetical protein [Fimbriimonadaceae bacterium]QYK55577.1 MAG: hypothetical protein KF733_11250 [Fimbriimonadaceae bacterium]